MKLLAYKPVLFDLQKDTVSPATNPGWEWPLKNVLTMQCLDGHKVPMDDCGCGIEVTLNAVWAQSFMDGTKEEPPEGYPCSTLAVVQLIGEIVLNDQWHGHCQSIYMWGIIRPLWLNDGDYHLQMFATDVKYGTRLGHFVSLDTAKLAVRAAYVDYTRR
jgi:hypothetical protein